MKGSNPLLDGLRGKVGNYVVTQKGDEVMVRKRVMENPSQSQAQAEHRAEFKATSQGFQLLSPAGRASYVALGQRMRSKRGKPLSGQNAYVSVTATRALQGLGPLPLAPVAPPVPGPQLPSPLFLSSKNDGLFTLVIHSAAAQGPFLLESAPWVTSGISYFRKSSFRVCANIENFSAGQSGIASDFLSHFTTPPAGSQIVIRLTPMTETGFRGLPIIYSAFVAATEAEMLLDLEERRAKFARTGRLELVAA